MLIPTPEWTLLWTLLWPSYVATGSHMSDTVTLLAPVWSLLLVNTSGIQATEAETQLIPEAA